MPKEPEPPATDEKISYHPQKSLIHPDQLLSKGENSETHPPMTDWRTKPTEDSEDYRDGE